MAERLATAVLALLDYRSWLEYFEFKSVWVTLVVIIVFHAIVVLLSLLLAAARYRDRFDKRHDD